MADTLKHEPNDSNDIQKRGRGRPRKEVQEPVEKRKVGRPKGDTIAFSSTKEYHVEYYKNHKHEVICPCCNKRCISSRTYWSHRRNNKTCLLIQCMKMNGEENLKVIDSKVATKYKKLLEDTEKERGE